MLDRHDAYIREHLEDMPEISDWTWEQAERVPAAGPILTVNAGSSSLKLRVLERGRRVGRPCRARLHRRRDVSWSEALGRSSAEASPLGAAGHRVVHGGADVRPGGRASTPTVEDQLDQLADLAPLHNPPALRAIRVLDAGFAPSCPRSPASTPPSTRRCRPRRRPTRFPPPGRERWALRRYGFHGLSHAYASRRAAELLGRPLAELRLVTAHLGAGASLAAVKGGRSVDTTMGFTPLEGLVMATRSGSVDPGLLLWVQRHERHRRRGDGASARPRGRPARPLRALADMREVLAGADAGDERCRLALRRLRPPPGRPRSPRWRRRWAASTPWSSPGGVGENAAPVRADACEGLAFLGVALDPGQTARRTATGCSHHPAPAPRPCS